MIYHIRGLYTTHAVRLDKYKLTWFLKSHHVDAYTLFLPLNFLQTNQYTRLFKTISGAVKPSGAPGLTTKLYVEVNYVTLLLNVFVLQCTTVLSEYTAVSIQSN
jgi:hypothetical protein